MKSTTKETLSAQDIKQSKDRINALRNSIPFLHIYESEEATVITQKKEFDKDEEEKEKCEKSDSESLSEDFLPSGESIVHNRIASYERPFEGSAIRRKVDNSCPKPLIACNEAYDPTEINREKFLALKKRYQSSVSNLAYESYDFCATDEGLKPDNEVPKERKESIAEDSYCFVPKKSRETSLSNKSRTTDPLISKLRSEIKNLDSNKSSQTSRNVIVGNKDILKLLSNKHLANLNIRVDKDSDFQKENLLGSKWKDNSSSYRAPKFGVRSSLRSSVRKRKCRYKSTQTLQTSAEEKGTSDSNLKENESGSEDEPNDRICEAIDCDSSCEVCTNGDYVKKKFPEYAKVNKKNKLPSARVAADIPPRSLSTSPIEKAPVVKKICSSTSRLKKDSEPTLAANPVKKADSFRGSRITRRNSFLYNTKGKSAKESEERESFVKTQAVRLRRRCSKNGKKSEYRVSVTIRPSTVADLADKFNTIILQNQSGNTSVQCDSLNKSSQGQSKGPKFYSSPRASFKRKYRHKSRGLRETKGKERIKCDVEIRKEIQAVDNTIYYSDNLSKRKSLNNSLSELNMKDLFDDCDYNKTDEEKVCEKLKTALSSGKFKGETDDSEDDLGPKNTTDQDEPTEQDAAEPEHDPHEKIVVENEDQENNLEKEPNIIETEGKEDNITPVLPEIQLKEDPDIKIQSSEKLLTDLDSIEGEKELTNSEKADEVSLDIKTTEASADEVEEGGEEEEEEEEEETTTLDTTVKSAMFVDNLTYGTTENITPNVKTIATCDIEVHKETSTEEESTSEKKLALKSSERAESFDKKVTDDLTSDCSSFVDDSYSEVSSICSDLKGKKSKGESRIYTSLKTVVKNTVKRTKEKDSERKTSEEMPQQKRSPSVERKKWYKRSKSKERKEEKAKEAKEGKRKEGPKIYEFWAFRKNREKSDETDKDKGKPKARNKNKNKDSKGNDTEEDDSEYYQDLTPSGSETPNEEFYGAVQFASRSRTREKRMAKEMKGSIKRISIPENIPENGVNGAESSLQEINVSNTDDSCKDSGSNEVFTKECSTLDKIKEEDSDVTSDKKNVANSDTNKDLKTKKLPTNLSLGEPCLPGGKVIPPPPKTPIPSPPKQFKRFFFKPKQKQLRKEEKIDGDNIYENIHTPNLQTLKENRRKLEEEGIKPISSFLWSDSAVLSAKATLSSNQLNADDTTLDLIYGDCFMEGRERQRSLKDDHDDQSIGYDKIGSSAESKTSFEDSNSEGHNYTEIQNNSSEDSQTISYDEIGAQSAVSYDEIAAPSSCGYDDIQVPSASAPNDNPRFESVLEGYDPVSPPKSDSSNYDDCGDADSLTHIEVVRQIQSPCHSYAYDDVSHYNASQSSHSYEPVCPPDGVAEVARFCPASSRETTIEDKTVKTCDDSREVSKGTVPTEEIVYSSDCSDSGPHEVFSYKLTRLGVSKDEDSPPEDLDKKDVTNPLPKTSQKEKIDLQPNKENSSQASKKATGKPSGKFKREGDKAKEMWEDIPGTEEMTDDGTVPITLTTKIPLVHKPRKPRRTPRYRVPKKSWAQGIRDVAAAHATRSHSLYITSGLAKVNPNSHGKAHITPTKGHNKYSGRGSASVVTCAWRQKPRALDSLQWNSASGDQGVNPPPCPPRPLKSSSFSSSSSYSSHSSSSSSSSSSFSSSPSSSSSQIDSTCGSEAEQVYVTSSSTIIIVCSNDENPYDANYESVYYNASNASGEASSDYQSAKMRSIFYEDANECQEISCFVEGVDSDSECQSPGHYEAIYEVINPTEEDESPAPQPPSEVDVQEEVKDDEEIKDDVLDDDYPMDDAYLDDSFDSDDSDDAYSRLQPQLTELKGPTLVPTTTSTLPAGLSCFDDKYLRRKYSRSQSHQGHSINKLAEAANLGMKRLRRNWSLTKNEVRTGLNRIKKKSAALSVADIRGVEDIVSDVTGSANEKGKWSLKRRFRRKSSASSPSGSQPTDESHQRDNATFYLTLTIASNGQDIEEGNAEGSSSTKERRHSMTPSVSSVATTTSCETSASTKPSTRPISAPAATLLRNSSVGSNSGTLFRPSNPPPAPPSTSSEVEDETSIDLSKDALALRLNQLLLAGPVPPPGRRILRTSESISNTDTAPVALLPPDDKTSSIKHSIPTLRAAQSLRQLFPESQTSLNVPKTRNSVASTSSSHGSSEGYIRPSEIASSPPPLPARPTSSSYPSLKRLSASNLSIHPPQTSSRTSDGDSKSYLDLTYEANQADEEPPYVSSHFADEPLYQFYTEKVERAALYQGDSSEDDYEVINDGGLNISNHNSGPRLTAMELVTPADGRRTLWCELPEVVSSGILNKISNQEKKLQEAMFEVITSEASYLNSLEVLVSHFMNCEELTEPDDPVISRRDKNVLFSDILPVKKCSELFLGDLEKRWQESFYISSITDIVLKHTTSSFSVYVKYCSNQIYQDRKLRDLKENNPRFVEVLGRLEMSPVCQSLAMQSFLMLPMQRVTRLPLLIDAIFNRLEYGSPQWQECKLALASLQKIVAECNEAARKMERMEEMLLISHQLDFREVKAIPLISASRWLVKKGELTRLTWREGDAKLTFGRKILKHSLYFFLFTDLLVVTKKKSDDQYMVLDYCPRNMVQVLELENADKFPGRILDGHKNLVIMTMLQNHESKTVEMVLSCPFESDRSRWMEAVTPRTSDNPDERIYEEWDCPQVQAIHAYTAQQPDELSLKISDVFNVLKKTPDGWYQGERLRDGARGWFPGNHTAEIASAHVRARNLRQRYRLLAISGSFVDELKKEKERFEKEERKKEKERRRTLTIKEVL